MSQTILKGTILSFPSCGKIEICENGYLIAENENITGIYKNIPEKYKNFKITDYGNSLIVPSFSDMHLHAPQYPMLGTGMDLPLLDWLNNYAFPTEAKFSDINYARSVYHCLARELIENGTTRVCMFSSLHVDSTLILMEELETAGITGYVGKVNMDRNGASFLQETTEESQKETLRWLDACKDFKYLKPILTPRFTPSCTNELMSFLGELAVQRNLPIQSHLSENQSEIEWVHKLHPDCQQYWETYAKYGLWNNRTLMAHCVWSDARERKAMKDSGITVVHCADSNQNICSGAAPIRVMLNEGLQVALGSDIAGGDHLNMFDVIGSAIRMSKMRRVMDNWHTDFLTETEGWYLGTSSAAAFFNEAPGFAPGNQLHAIVLQDNKLFQPHSLTPEERLDRAIYRRQSDALQAVWSAGRCVFQQ